MLLAIEFYKKKMALLLENDHVNAIRRIIQNFCKEKF